MPDYLLLMHNDAPVRGDWDSYFADLNASGHFQGGSAIGGGVCVRKWGAAPEIARHLTGFIRIEADSLEHARSFLAGNPVFESGGTVEIRELPRSHDGGESRREAARQD